jgi:hypothetical protein
MNYDADADIHDVFLDGLETDTGVTSLVCCGLLWAGEAGPCSSG